MKFECEIIKNILGGVEKRNDYFFCNTSILDSRDDNFVVLVDADIISY
jgi:hypothetical protein